MKRFLSAMLVLILLFSLTVCVFAENGIDGKSEKSITISYTVSGNYELFIPPTGAAAEDQEKLFSTEKEITLMPSSEEETIADFSVKVANVLLESGTVLRISVRSQNGFSLTLPDGASVPYILTGPDEDGTVLLLRPGETAAEKTLSITLGDTSGLKYAGTYFDRLTFDCEILSEDEI